MNASFAAGWVLAAGLVAAAAGAGQTAGVTQNELDEVIHLLWADGVRWADDQPVEPAAEVRLKEVWFTPESVPLLNVAIRAIDPNTIGLYVIDRLAQRVSFAETATIRAALPVYKDLNSRMRKTYQSFPSLSDEQVKALQKPTSSSRAAREALEKRRQEKLRMEKAIAKYNQMVYVLEKYTYRLMLLAKDPTQDQALAEDLVYSEQNHSAIWLTILEGMADEARLMSQERGETIYKVLRPHGLKLKMDKQQSYVLRGRSKLREDDRSSHEVVTVYPGIKMLSTLNRIATAAKMPALKVPKPKDVEKYHQDLEKKRRGGRPPRT